jgi:hypothetical protein
MALRNAFEELATEPTLEAVLNALEYRYSGGKVPATETVTASGDTTVLTPATGQAIRLFWVSAIADPDAVAPPLITVKLGALECYRAYAIAHWEVFEGAVDAALVVNLSEAADVAVTVHYQEV